MFSRTVLVCVGLILSLEVATCNRGMNCINDFAWICQPVVDTRYAYA